MFSLFLSYCWGFSFLIKINHHPNLLPSSWGAFYLVYTGKWQKSCLNVDIFVDSGNPHGHGKIK